MATKSIDFREQADTLAAFVQEALGVNKGYEYARGTNPTRQALERNVASLEGARHGFAFSSGMGCLTSLMMLFKAGDHIVCGENVYGGTYRLFDKIYRNFGLTFSFVDTRDPQKARTDGVALVLGPLFSNSAAALSSSVRRGGANVIAFSNDESAAQPGVFIMGIAAPPQVRRVVDYALQSGIKRFATFAPRTAYGEQMSRTLESHVSARGGKVVAAELFDEGAPDLTPAAQRLAKEANVEDAAAGKIAVLVPVAPPRSATVLGALNGVGIDKASVQFIGTGVWDTLGIGADAQLRGAWYAAPDPARRVDFERRFTATYGRPPHRLATLAYDAVALASQLARQKPGGDFSVEAITNPNGWSGIDGVFRFLPDGRAERTLAVIEIQGERNAVVSPAPTSFVGTN